MSAIQDVIGNTNIDGTGRLHRTIDWTGAFWIASGVPALVLFSIGGIAGNVGTFAFMIWILSMAMGFIQSFTYAEIAGLFPNKSGGASVYGATAWLRYGKFIAPLSVWCNWIAWTPVLSLGCSIAASYILNALAPIPAADSTVVQTWLAAHAGAKPEDAIAALTPAIRTWSLISFHIPGIVDVALNATFVIGTVLMLAVFAIQHRGVLGTARVQMWVGLVVIVPMAIVGIVPLFNGAVDWNNFSPLVPLAAPYEATPGSWNITGWTLVLGAMFICAWSTYGFETAICYTSEFRNPAKDTFKAIFFSGLLCIVLFTLVPFTFQGVLGLNGMLATPIVDGSGVAEAMSHMVRGGEFVDGLLQMLMILALLLCIMTAMAGSSRTLYQGSVDGWLPRYLSHVNEHGAPTRAMWTDLVFNLILLSFASSDAASYFTILAISNCGYIIFNFLNLNAGWIHRIDNGHIKRPFKTPTVLIALGTLFSFVNAAFMGAGAKVWNPNALWMGFGAALLILPVFWYRHYVQDKGKFPEHMLDDIGLKGTDLAVRRAGFLPYLTLAAGIAVVLVTHFVFTL
ncbi:MAG: APC family permease [Burkholderiales bacterium]|nr:APC family permease [Burkholderiales bacterium]